MQKRNNIKDDSLYEYYSEIEDDYEKKWKKKDFNSFISNQHNIFILSQPEPVGFIKARIIKDEIEIISILIDKNFRKKGIGKGLLNDLLSLANKKKIQHIFLEVSVENKVAINLYKKFNFIKIGERKDYYNLNGRNINANIMRLVLF
ncbi:MAG: ribosomal-protein-alanine N-acetyltransferase [Rickettsiales bacterium]|nr:ribosomal-protein-alanine N-acetyltransferase [Rickettsiales bacterium]OUV99340.1 MAG: ribosomal-protein-alanine N-acetyltransferase [Betaproteobacteria bacterium TMED156]